MRASYVAPRFSCERIKFRSSFDEWNQCLEFRKKYPNEL